MARMYGGKSKYLIFGDISNYIMATLYSFFLIYLFYFILTRYPEYFFSIYGIVALVIVAGPLILFLYYQREKHRKAADKFFRGRKGEGAIFYEFVKMPDSYCVFQDIKLGGRGNIDFVLVGPEGIFVIEAKSHVGQIGFNGQELTRNNRIFSEKDILKQAMGQALGLHDYLKEKTGKEVFVKPVIVFSNPGAYLNFGLKAVNNVFVVQKRFLQKLIYSQPKILSENQISEIEESLKPLFLNSSPSAKATDGQVRTLE